MERLSSLDAPAPETLRKKFAESIEAHIKEVQRRWEKIPDAGDEHGRFYDHVQQMEHYRRKLLAESTTPLTLKQLQGMHLVFKHSQGAARLALQKLEEETSRAERSHHQK